VTGSYSLVKPTTWLVRVSAGPSDLTKLFQGLDCVLACGAFEQSVSVVAVAVDKTWLTAPSNSEDVTLVSERLERDPIKLLRSLPLYDIAEIFVLDAEKVSLRADLNELTLSPIGGHDFQQLIANSQFTLGF